MSAKKQRRAKVTKEYLTASVEATPALKRIIRRLRKMHFPRKGTSDAVIFLHLVHMAFLIPDRISDALDCFVKYRNSEGFGDAGAKAVEQLAAAAAVRFEKAVSR